MYQIVDWNHHSIAHENNSDNNHLQPSMIPARLINGLPHETTSINEWLPTGHENPWSILKLPSHIALLYSNYISVDKYLYTCIWE